jgi:hypothetical protein
MSRGAGRVSLPIDVIIPAVGRIKKQSGVFTKGERDELVAMLKTLPKQGNVALVQDIQAGRRGLLDVYPHYVAGTLAQLQGPQDDAALAPILEPWLDTAQCADGTRENRRAAFRTLQADRRRAYLLRDLPEMVQSYKAECERDHYPRAFNIARTAVQAFLRDCVGKRKPLTLAVADIEQLKERKKGRKGLALADAIAVRDGLGGAAGRVWWSMVLTGMGPKEYFTDGWQVLADRVHINGEKTEYRGRDVPLVDYPVRPEIKRTGFNSAIRRYSIAAGITFNPYQARKSFTRWMEEARVPRARRVAYLGHSAADVQDAYELYEIDAYLREDAERMRALIGPHKLALAQ